MSIQSVNHFWSLPLTCFPRWAVGFLMTYSSVLLYMVMVKTPFASSIGEIPYLLFSCGLVHLLKIFGWPNIAEHVFVVKAYLLIDRHDLWDCWLLFSWLHLLLVRRNRLVASRENHA